MYQCEANAFLIEFMNAVQDSSYTIRSYSDKEITCTLTGRGANTKLWHITGAGIDLLSAIEKARDNAAPTIRESLLSV